MPDKDRRIKQRGRAAGHEFEIVAFLEIVNTGKFTFEEEYKPKDHSPHPLIRRTSVVALQKSYFDAKVHELHREVRDAAVAIADAFVRCARQQAYDEEAFPHETFPNQNVLLETQASWVQSAHVVVKGSPPGYDHHSHPAVVQQTARMAYLVVFDAGVTLRITEGYRHLYRCHLPECSKLFFRFHDGRNYCTDACKEKAKPLRSPHKGHLAS